MIVPMAEMNHHDRAETVDVEAERHWERAGQVGS